MPSPMALGRILVVRRFVCPQPIGGLLVLFFCLSSLSKKSKSKSAPKETTAGSGGTFKSKEFISDNEASSSSGSDSDDKPLKQKKSKRQNPDASSASEAGSVRRLLANSGGRLGWKSNQLTSLQ